MSGQMYVSSIPGFRMEVPIRIGIGVRRRREVSKFSSTQGINWSPVNSPHKGQWRRALMFSLICTWIKCCVNSREAVDLRHHRAHYDVTVMIGKYSSICLTHLSLSTAWWKVTVTCYPLICEMLKMIKSSYFKVNYFICSLQFSFWGQLILYH